MAKPRKQKAGEQPSKPAGGCAAAGAVRRQKICLAIDLEKHLIYGHTEMEIITPESEVIGLNAASLSISSIFVNNEPAEFEYFEPQPSSKADESFHPDSSHSTTATEACSLYISSLEKEIMPNLFISCSKPTSSQSNHDSQADEAGKLPNPETQETVPNGDLDHDADQGMKENVKLVRINYKVNAAACYMFFGNGLMCTDNQIRRARCWFPCMDTSSHYSCYDLELTVDSNLVVVSNGELLYQVLSEEQPLRKTYVYKLDIPVSANWISLAVAPFEILVDTHNNLLSYMSMASDFQKLRNTVGFFHTAFSYFEDYLSTSFPFKSYKQVFVPQECSLSSENISASMCVFGSDLLFDEKVIDETIETRVKLAYAVAKQWFGVYIVPESQNDEWLVDGIAGFLTDSFIKRFLGNNEARYCRYKANCAVCKADVSGATSLSSSAATKDLYGTHHLGYFGKVHRWKSIAVLQMLEKQMGPESFRKILQLIIFRTQDLARPLRTLSTKEFRHFANKIGNLERPFLKEFFPRWVESCGCPVLWMGFSYNKRRNMIEMAAVRDSTAPISSSNLMETAAENREGFAGWPGMMSIRVHELDGVYDHPSLSLTGETCQLLEIQCHSKLAAKRILKPKKGPKYEGAEDNGDAVVTTDLRGCMDSPLLWLRVDPEMEYLAEFRFHQPAQMWVNQMEKDKDVVAQSQAIAMLQALSQHPFSVINAFNNLLNDSKAFWRVRIEAAIALAQTASEDSDWAGLHYLIKFYKSRRFDPEIWFPMPNDFRDVSEYFVLKAIPNAIALVRATDGTSPREAVEFILQLLKYNDNSGNPYSDAHWLAALVQSMSHLEFGPQNVSLLPPLLKRIDRLLLFDSLMPSHNSILTISCIRTLALIALKLSSHVPSDRIFNLMKSFKDDQRVPWKVRLEASKALLSLEFHWNGLNKAICLFLQFLSQEASPRGQNKLAAHAVRICEANEEAEVQQAVGAATLVALLDLLGSRKVCNNIYLRHHLFCMLQTLAGRPPTLYGMPRGKPQTLQEQLLVGVEEESKHRMISSFLNLSVDKPQEGGAGDKQPIIEEKQEKPIIEVEVPVASSSEAVPPSGERKWPVVKIKVRQPTLSKGPAPNEPELGPTSSVSVDAPQHGPPQNPDEMNSTQDRGSRMGNEEVAKELQSTAASKESLTIEGGNNGKKSKKREKKERKRKEGEDEAEYLERKRLKKEKKRKEKELAKAQKKEALDQNIPQPEEQFLPLPSSDVKISEVIVEPKPVQASTVGTKVRIKLKRSTGT